MDTDAIADSNSFDVSGTSVASLQGFLDGALVISIALLLLLLLFLLLLPALAAAKLKIIHLSGS